MPEPNGELLEEHGFEVILAPLAEKHGQDVINDIFSGLENYSKLSTFPDDVSVIMIEHRGAK